MSKKYKLEKRTTTVAAAIGDAYSELQALRDEAQEIVDNAPDGLRETQRIQDFESTASELDSCVDEEPDVPSSVAELEVKWLESVSRRGAVSRAVRCSNAVSMLTGAVEAISNAIDSGKLATEELEDITEMQETLNGVIDSAAGCEWPGMFG